MIYEIILAPEFKIDIAKHQKAGDKKLIKKISLFLAELKFNPRQGTGKPEQLKGFEHREMWSRRINQKHRLIYEIRDTELVVIAVTAYGHYDDK